MIYEIPQNLELNIEKNVKAYTLLPPFAYTNTSVHKNMYYDELKMEENTNTLQYINKINNT